LTSLHIDLGLSHIHCHINATSRPFSTSYHKYTASATNMKLATVLVLAASVCLGSTETVKIFGGDDSIEIFVSSLDSVS
jgi:hypothetical protein